MITRSNPIPSAFIRQDTRTNAADSFANCRDHLVQRMNHNILLARNVKMPIFTMIACNDEGDAGPTIIKTFAIGAQDFGESFCSFPIPISPFCKYMVFKIRAALEHNAAPDVELLPRIAPLDGTQELTGDSITVNNAAETTFSVDVPVPPKAAFDGVGIFSILVGGGMTGADLKGAIPLTVTASGPNWFTCTTIAPATVGDAAYFPSDNDIEPRIITDVDINVAWPAANNDMITVFPSFNKVPIANTDTVNFRNTQGVELYSAVLYEKSVSNWNALVTLV